MDAAAADSDAEQVRPGGRRRGRTTARKGIRSPMHARRRSGTRAKSAAVSSTEKLAAASSVDKPVAAVKRPSKAGKPIRGDRPPRRYRSWVALLVAIGLQLWLSLDLSTMEGACVSGPDGTMWRVRRSPLGTTGGQQQGGPIVQADSGCWVTL